LRSASAGTIFGSSTPARRRWEREKRVKKDREDNAVAEAIRPEYDFSQAERGRYVRRFAEGTNIVVLDPDLARLFPDSFTVNRALRVLSEIARREIADQSSSR